MVKKSGLEKCKKNERSRGFHTRRFVLSPNTIPPLNRFSLLIAISAAAVGGQVLSPPSLYQYFVCPSMVTGFYRAKKSGLRPCLCYLF
jgi:hypothetical protein